jgi:hypothetical protein
MRIFAPPINDGSMVTLFSTVFFDIHSENVIAQRLRGFTLTAPWAGSTDCTEGPVRSSGPPVGVIWCAQESARSIRESAAVKKREDMRPIVKGNL